MTFATLRALAAGIFTASLLLVSSPSMATEKAGVRPGFEESQIAEWSDADIVEFDKQLTVKGHITRDR